MRRIPFISALIGVIAGLFSRRRGPAMTKRTLLLASPEDKPRNKVARRKRITYQKKLRRKFAKNALERYGLDVKGPDGKPDKETVRVMRNARKLERRAAR